MDIQSYMEFGTLIISLIALIISYFSFKESKKARIELGRAFLSMDLIQTSDGLYSILCNVGNTYAYDVEVTVSDHFVNGFKNLSVVQPSRTYRFLLLNGQNISDYPEIITFTVKYHDYYSQKRSIKKVFKFKIIDYLKYDMRYSKDFDCYDIEKTF